MSTPKNKAAVSKKADEFLKEIIKERYEGGLPLAEKIDDAKDWGPISELVRSKFNGTPFEQYVKGPNNRKISFEPRSIAKRYRREIDPRCAGAHRLTNKDILEIAKYRVKGRPLEELEPRLNTSKPRMVCDYEIIKQRVKRRLMKLAKQNGGDPGQINPTHQDVIDHLENGWITGFDRGRSSGEHQEQEQAHDNGEQIQPQTDEPSIYVGDRQVCTVGDFLESVSTDMIQKSNMTFGGNTLGSASHFSRTVDINSSSCTPEHLEPPTTQQKAQTCLSGAYPSQLEQEDSSNSKRQRSEPEEEDPDHSPLVKHARQAILPTCSALQNISCLDNDNTHTETIPIDSASPPAHCPANQSKHERPITHMKDDTHDRGISRVDADTFVRDNIVVHKADDSFHDIIALDDIKSTLNETVVLPLVVPSLFQSKLMQPPNGVLLFGPRRTGKTALVKAAANACEASLFHVSASLLVSKTPKESVDIVNHVFKMAYLNAPSIVFVDNIDVLTTTSDATKAQLHSLLLEQFDTAVLNFRNAGTAVRIVAETDRPWILDQKLLEWFDMRIYVAPPDPSARRQMIQSLLKEIHLTSEQTTHQFHRFMFYDENPSCIHTF